MKQEDKNTAIFGTREKKQKNQHFWWFKIRDHIRDHVKKCMICQKKKIKNMNYGHAPPKEAQIIQWDKMCIDLIGPYKIRRKGKSDLKCSVVTLIDSATSWFEINQIWSSVRVSSE